jgi:hypothetical protein
MRLLYMFPMNESFIRSSKNTDFEVPLFVIFPSQFNFLHVLFIRLHDVVLS